MLLRLLFRNRHNHHRFFERGKYQFEPFEQMQKLKKIVRFSDHVNDNHNRRYTTTVASGAAAEELYG